MWEDKTPIVNCIASEMVVEDSITDKATIAAIAVSLVLSILSVIWIGQADDKSASESD